MPLKPVENSLSRSLTELFWKFLEGIAKRCHPELCGWEFSGLFGHVIQTGLRASSTGSCARFRGFLQKDLWFPTRLFEFQCSCESIPCERLENSFNFRGGISEGHKLFRDAGLRTHRFLWLLRTLA
eukprot:g12865.t1